MDITKYSYITLSEVQKVCQDIGISDWTNLQSADIDIAEAGIISQIIGAEATEIPVENFKLGLEIELEHGFKFPDANVTGNHPILTGLIVLAHLKEALDYYLRLECMELEMELAAAIAARNADRTATKRGDLAKARARLEQSVSNQLS